MTDFNTFKAEYNTAKDKVECLKKHVRKSYIPYVDKINECREIIERSSYKEVNEKRVYWKNTPVQYFLFINRLIANYTDIDLGDNATDSFDFLNKNGIVAMILAPSDIEEIVIPVEEISEWRTILSMCEDDEYENNRSLVSILDTKIESVGMVIDTLISAFEEASKSPEIVKMLKGLVSEE